MIQTVKIDELPEELIIKLFNKNAIETIKIYPLRQLSEKTGIAINTLRKIRENKEASLNVWIKLSEKL